MIIFGVMVLVILAMSVGVIFAGKPIKGSCGGMSALGMDVACDICGGDKNKCETSSEGALSQNGEVHPAFYDASGHTKN